MRGVVVRLRLGARLGQLGAHAQVVALLGAPAELRGRDQEQLGGPRRHQDVPQRDALATPAARLGQLLARGIGDREPRADARDRVEVGGQHAALRQPAGRQPVEVLIAPPAEIADRLARQRQLVRLRGAVVGLDLGARIQRQHANDDAVAAGRVARGGAAHAHERHRRRERKVRDRQRLSRLGAGGRDHRPAHAVQNLDLHRDGRLGRHVDARHELRPGRRRDHAPVGNGHGWRRSGVDAAVRPRSANAVGVHVGLALDRPRDGPGDGRRRGRRDQEALRLRDRVVGLDLRDRGDLAFGLGFGRHDDRRAVGFGQAGAWTGGEREEQQQNQRFRPGPHSLPLGWIVAINSASATKTSPTLASPRSFQIALPFRSGTTSSVSTSPGMTGLRNFALSIAMK